MHEPLFVARWAWVNPEEFQLLLLLCCSPSQHPARGAENLLPSLSRPSDSGWPQVGAAAVPSTGG